MDSLKSLIRSYESWVAANPDTVTDLETTTKWVSYFVAGRISNSNVLSELIYSLSNILVLYNDRIIAQSRPEECAVGAAAAALITQTDAGDFCYRLKVILTTLEYCEVFIEISAKRLFGNKGKWLFIVILQVVKAAGRFFILKHSTEKIITSPTLPTINRRTLSKQPKVLLSSSANGGSIVLQNNKNISNTPAEHSFTFKLKRSGRLVRKVEGAPPLQYRSFKLHAEVLAEQQAIIPQALLQAEYLYIAKPLIHLAAMGVFGEKRWKQYVIALSLDLISIHLYHKNRHLMSKQQKLEMSRRCINLLLYLMRSPFYESFTQNRLERVLDFITNSIPFAKMIASPLRDYIPHWQNMYFYLWST